MSVIIYNNKNLINRLNFKNKKQIKLYRYKMIRDFVYTFIIFILKKYYF